MCIRLAWNNTQQSTGSFHVGKYACVSSDNPDDQIQPYKSTTASKQEEHHNTCSRQVSETQTRQPTTPSTRQSSKATVNTIDIPTCTAGGGYKQSHRRGVQADERPREWWPLQQTNEHRTRHKQPSNQTKRQPTGQSQTVTTLLTWANNQEWVLLDNELWWLRNYDDWGIMVIEGARILWSGHRMMSDVCSDQFWLGSDWWEMHKKTIVNFDGRLQIIWKIGEMKFQNY